LQPKQKNWKDDSLAWIAEEEAIALKNNPEISLYSNSENALAWIDQTMEKVNYQSQF
jgi:hypothetical protein